MSSVVYLQAAFVEQAAVGPAVPADERTAILLIDDQRESLSELVEILERVGYTCLCASAFEAARQCVRSRTPSLVIAGANLSGASGIALCEELLHEEGLRAPVMYLSGSQIPHIIRRHHAAGGAYHLRKPFHPDVLLALIAKALADYRCQVAGR